MKLRPLSTYLLIILFGSANPVFAQNPQDTGQLSARHFELTITDYNHASMIYAGTMIYVLSDSVIKVFNLPLFEKKRNLLFSTSIPGSAQSIIDLSNSRLDTLKDLYSNYCVMITSGEEYGVTFRNSDYKKHIYLHHYYSSPIAYIIALANKSLPENYQIHYLSKDTKQDCSPF